MTASMAKSMLFFKSFSFDRLVSNGGDSLSFFEFKNEEGDDDKEEVEVEDEEEDKEEDDEERDDGDG